MDTMGQRLRVALEKREMTVADLIKATKLSKATIYFILGGPTKPEKIRASTVEKICRVLRIRREWLLEGKPPMDADNGKDRLTGTQGATERPQTLFTREQGARVDAAALQVAMRSFVTTVLNRIPGTAEVFRSYLMEAAEKGDFPTNTGLLASFLGIADEALDAEAAAAQALQRARAGGRRKPRK